MAARWGHQMEQKWGPGFADWLADWWGHQVTLLWVQWMAMLLVAKLGYQWEKYLAARLGQWVD